MRHVHAFRDDALGDLDATGVAAAIAAREISPSEALEAALDRIDRVDPILNAVAIDDRDRARRRASADAFPPGSFAGVPSIIKNDTDMQGIPTLHGSAALPDVKKRKNAKFTDQLLSTGVNIVGASRLPAFGLTASTEFEDADPTVNPWDTDFSCGASSGGSAALVASGALPIAHGNDGGGSIRIPASACGLVGLKPTRGRVVQAAEGKLLPVDLISNGVLTRTVRDTAAFIYSAEKFSPAKAMAPVGLVEGPSSRRFRIGVVAEALTTEIDDPTTATLDDTVALLTSLGHEIDYLRIPFDQSFVDQFTCYWGFLAFGCDHLGKITYGMGFDPAKVDQFDHELAKTFIRQFWQFPGAITGLKRASKKFLEFFGTYDLILTPTLSQTLPRIGYLSPAGDFTIIFDRLLKFIASTPMNNAAGSPGLSLPIGQSPEGLPIGMHFSADRGNERALLEIAFELEAARPFARIHDTGVDSADAPDMAARATTRS